MLRLTPQEKPSVPGCHCRSHACNKALAPSYLANSLLCIDLLMLEKAAVASTCPLRIDSATSSAAVRAAAVKLPPSAGCLPIT